MYASRICLVKGGHIPAGLAPTLVSFLSAFLALSSMNRVGLVAASWRVRGAGNFPSMYTTNKKTDRHNVRTSNANLNQNKTRMVMTSFKICASFFTNSIFEYNLNYGYIITKIKHIVLSFGGIEIKLFGCKLNFVNLRSNSAIL